MFAWIGIGLVLIMVASGLFLIRFAGYIFCSNIMNRKRVVALRAAFAKSHGWLEHIPPPRRSEDVWISGGYRAFPYMLAALNFLLLFLLLPFLYLLWGSTSSSPLPSATATLLTILCIVAIPYPRSCHRYASDIFIAEHFYEEDTAPFNQTQRELKDLYHSRLKAKEQRDRPRQVRWLVVYFSISILLVASCIWYASGQQAADWTIVVCSLTLLTIVLRLWTLNYRIPRHNKHKNRLHST